MNSGDLDAAGAFVDQFGRDGSVRMKLCCDLTLYLEGSPRDSRAGLLAFYERALALIGPNVTHVSSGKSTAFRKTPKDMPALLDKWFDGGGPEKGSYSLYLESGASPDDVSDRAFAFVWVLGHGYVRLVLPAGTGLVNPEGLRKAVVELAGGIGFSSGHAGYSVNVDVDYDSSVEGGAVGRVSRRFLGLDLDKPLYWSAMTKDAIKTVNWLTLLGPRLFGRVVGALGGVSQFQAALGPGVSFHPVGKGVLLQAGPAPALGDVDAGERLVEYRQVAAALQALKIRDDVLRGYDSIGGTANTRLWLDRFA